MGLRGGRGVERQRVEAGGKGCVSGTERCPRRRGRCGQGRWDLGGSQVCPSGREEGCGGWSGRPGRVCSPQKHQPQPWGPSRPLRAQEAACPGCATCPRLVTVPSVPPRLKGSGLKVRFCTNESQKSRGRLVGELRRLGFDISEAEVTAPPPAACRLLQERGLRPHLLVHDGRPVGAPPGWGGSASLSPGPQHREGRGGHCTVPLPSLSRSSLGIRSHRHVQPKLCGHCGRGRTLLLPEHEQGLPGAHGAGGPRAHLPGEGVSRVRATGRRRREAGGCFSPPLSSFSFL